MGLLLAAKAPYVPPITLGGVANGSASGASQVNVALSKASAGDIVCVFSYSQTGFSGTTRVAATSVTASGLTFTRRALANQSASGCLEFWWAQAASARAGVAITINYSGTFDAASAVAFGLSGANPAGPFDSNPACPTAMVPAVDPWTPSFNAATTLLDDFVLFAVGTATAAFAFTGTAPGGLSPISHLIEVGTDQYASLLIYGGTVNRVQSTFLSWPSGAAFNDENGVGWSTQSLFDALTADVGGHAA